MAPTKSAKRQAEAPAAPAKKCAKTDPVEEKCETVVEALGMATELPEASRTMLAAMVPFSLGVARDQRHQHQQAVIDMVEQEIMDVDTEIAGRVAGHQQKLDEALAGKAGLEAARDEISESVRAKCQEVEEHQTKQSEAAATRAAAEGALAAARRAQAEAAAAPQKAAEQRVKCLAVASEHLAKVQEESWEGGAGAKKHVAALLNLGREMDFDTSLLSGLPAAAAKPAGERGPFDTMLIQQCQEQFNQKIKSLDEVIAGGETVAAEHAPKVQAAEAELEGARAREQEAANVVATAEAEAEELGEKERAAKKAVRDVGPGLRKAQAAHAKASKELEDFRATHLSAFESLRDRDSQPASTPEVSPKAEVPIEAEEPEVPIVAGA